MKQCNVNYVNQIEEQLDKAEDLDANSLTLLQSKLREFEAKQKIEQDLDLSMKLKQQKEKAQKLEEYKLQQQQAKQEFKDFNKWWESNRRIRPQRPKRH